LKVQKAQYRNKEYLWKNYLKKFLYGVAPLNGRSLPAAKTSALTCFSAFQSRRLDEQDGVWFAAGTIWIFPEVFVWQTPDDALRT